MKKVNLNALVESLSGGKIVIREVKNSNESVDVLRKLYGNSVSIVVGAIPAIGVFLYSKEPLKGTVAIAAGKDSQGEWFYVYE